MLGQSDINFKISYHLKVHGRMFSSLLYTVRRSLVIIAVSLKCSLIWFTSNAAPTMMGKWLFCIPRLTSILSVLSFIRFCSVLFSVLCSVQFMREKHVSVFFWISYDLDVFEMILRVSLMLMLCWGALDASSCPKAPRHLNPGRRTRGDNGYRLVIGDNPNGYIPGKTYNSEYQ